MENRKIILIFALQLKQNAMEKDKIEEGALLLHRLKRVSAMITHINTVEGDLVKLTVGVQGNYPPNSYYAPVSREVANELVASLEKEKAYLEAKIAAL